MDQDTLVAVCKTLRVTSDYLLGLNPFPFDVQNQFTDEEVEFMLESVKVYRDTKEKYEQKRP
ncbi:hypothetical protein JCM19046_3492 [Bacillus sp. JCM 19046]|nr:hypothetical protein JCM19045_4283 [Bacillus sp. JCM 19045]GAF18883.1 hypothetical protein JCM19046_3492 [Bacillus sp. JCM 19046]